MSVPTTVSSESPHSARNAALCSLTVFEARDATTLQAFANAVEHKVLGPMRQATLEVQHQLLKVEDSTMQAHVQRMLGELQQPSLTTEPAEADPRDPVTAGILCGLAGALLAWAASRGPARPHT